MKWAKKLLQKSRRCCECDKPESPFWPLFRWCDHNDSGWVHQQCAQLHGYLEYIKFN
jgi:hypothetical protein